MLRENIRMAMESIKSNKMRTFLTMLGIIIGISSVIMIVSAGDGAKQEMMNQFEGIGTNTVIISTDSKKATKFDHFTYEDLAAVKEKVPNAGAVSMVYQYYGNAIFRNTEMFALIAGGTEDIMKFTNVELVSGRHFTREEFLSNRNICLIDEHMANKFFGNTDVAGMEIDFSLPYEGETYRMKLKIIGVVSSEMGQFYREGMPGTVYMPISTLFRTIGREERFTDFYIMSDDKDATEQVGNMSLNLMKSRHNAQNREVYYVSNMMSQVDMVNDMLGMIQTFIAAVAAISLLVGGIGVMNIMLVAVTERTREIGIRKALGAKTGSILFQFLTESAIMTLIGGLIGLVLGYAGGIAICSVAGIEPVFSASAIMGTIIFSASVGLFFGIYPARKAARLNPIDALRHE